MIKKTGVLASLFLALLIMLVSCIPAGTPVTSVSPAGPAPTSQAAPAAPAPIAVNQLSVLDSSVAVSFPSQLTFKIKAASTNNISDIRLHYVIDRKTFANITSEAYVTFTPGATVAGQWVWDMRQTGGLPTGATLKYWWTVKDASGAKIDTTPASLSFDDNRYTWQSLTDGMLTLYWYNGDLSFGRQLMTAAQDAVTRLTQDTGAYLKTSVKIYIYANTQDLQGAMIFPQEWTGGVNFPDFGIITIGIDTSNLDWGKGALAHELTHQVVHQMTFNPYIDLPTWLDEGLAMHTETMFDANLKTSLDNTLKTALANNSLISVRSLASPFSADTNLALLSYAESYSFVEYLITTYGQSKMLDLLTTFSQGSTYDNALLKVYGFNMDGLNQLWLPYVHKQYQIPQPKTNALPQAFIKGLNEMAASIVLYPRFASFSGAGR